MHKSYQSILPCQSRILKERWDRKYYDEHRDKVREAKSVVDTKPPTTYVHLHLKLKKLQLEEERLATVERDNRILLEKMSQIMRTKGRVDNHNDYISRSLNKEKRRRELIRVTQENQEILKRILAREPEYNHLEWDKEWEENENFMDNVSRYPRDWWELEKQEQEMRKQELKERRKKDSKKSKSKKRTKSREEKSPEAREEQEEMEEKDEERPEDKHEDKSEEKDEDKSEEETKAEEAATTG
ncbi:hypothetical protein BSL78_16596 [Apostichopus japonicus]|uniref:Uncharacterized protein n=1 Tax=Stichopus japonicus TaxID=307972 RepID=A0A2G8KEW4_STIJA|nr:hypothetical protein BSL78_16596 [Apostichopus japonicus]